MREIYQEWWFWALVLAAVLIGEYSPQLIGGN